MADGEEPNWQADLTSMLSQESWPVDLAEIVDKLSKNIPLNIDDDRDKI